MTSVSTLKLTGPLEEDPRDPHEPLSSDQRQQLIDAVRRARKLNAAANVAAFNGCATGLFAAVSLAAGVFRASSLVIAVGLAFVAWNEFRGRDQLRRFQVGAARLLGWNQLILLLLLVAYSVWSICSALAGPDPYAAHLAANPELRTLLEPVGRLHTVVTLAVYGGVILLSLLFQGLNSAYYFSRGRVLSAYLDQTPGWVVRLQRQW